MNNPSQKEANMGAPIYIINNITYRQLNDPEQVHCRCHPNAIIYQAIFEDDLNNKVRVNWNFTEFGVDYPKDKLPWKEIERMSVEIYETPEEPAEAPRMGVR